MHTRLLEWLGYKVTCHTSPVRALADLTLSPDRFDLVITDYTMPEMNGTALAQKIFALTPDTPVLLCSGLGETVDDAATKEIFAVMPKPMELKALSTWVRRALEGRSFNKAAVR